MGSEVKRFRGTVWTRTKDDVQAGSYRNLQRHVVEIQAESEEAYRAELTTRFTWVEGDEVVFGTVSEVVR